MPFSIILFRAMSTKFKFMLQITFCLVKYMTFGCYIGNTLFLTQNYQVRSSFIVNIY